MKKIISIFVMVFGLVGFVFAENPFRKYTEELNGIDNKGRTVKQISYKSFTAASWDLEKWLLETYDDLYPKELYGFFEIAKDKCEEDLAAGYYLDNNTSMYKYLMSNNMSVACKVVECEDLCVFIYMVDKSSKKVAYFFWTFD